MARVKPLSEVLRGVTRFGRLSVIGEAPAKVAASGFAAKCAVVMCDCGAEKIVRAGDLRNGYATSCGCLQRELAAARTRARVTTHGQTGTAMYRIWTGMKNRCFNPQSKDFPNYGGRGITVCERWRDSFEAFVEDMGPRPTSNHSLDRIDVHGIYQPGNVRWSTVKAQANNRRSNVTVEIDGVTRTVTEWAEAMGISSQAIFKRLEKGWPERAAILTGKRGRQPPP